ncbi:hypothetical protein E1B28_005347 [Marasmius oreades]|uniref:Cytochrome P450 n=1 Tax=Marasmius oreades TaxID=181124 RepID=A0A9P7UVL5_9AGAR|nr:uncharacterized protein E1B28_005347 [Marasmius oreades]KAG7094516.1 hypothetical protein E1B28_005347 [Marasmius oreades]
MLSIPLSVFLCGCVSLYFLSGYIRNRELNRKLDAIPTIGTRGLWPFASILHAYRFLVNAREMFQEGYDKYRGGIFKIHTLTKWKVVVTSQKQIEDIRKAPDDVLDPREANVEALEMDYTMGRPLHDDPYELPVIRGVLTRNISSQLTEVRDEVLVAFEELLPPKDDWVTISLNPTMQIILSRVNNRFFVGLPVCRNQEFIDTTIKFAVEIPLYGQFIALFPDFCKPIIGNIFTGLHRSVKRARKHLLPIIQERVQKEEEYGTTEWPGKPNDFLSWLLDAASGAGDRRKVDNLVMRVLGVNFGIHTTGGTLSNVLNYLTLYPEYIPDLRAEIEAVIEEHGWTKVALGRMKKLDSFIKEVQRINPSFSFSVERKVLKDFTLFDGTVIPAGVTLGVPVLAVQHDESVFPNAKVFNGFRFAEMREREDESTKHQMVTSTPDFFLFGNGHHACPGRFFAVTELKLILSHILLNYDIKGETEGGAKMKWFAFVGFQDNNAKFSFRKRRRA